MSRYIDADKIVITAERGRSYDGLIFIPVIDAHRCIDATPTAEVVEVVRCGECRYCKYIRSADIHKCERREHYSEQVNVMDYCSYGERIENGT